jgi:hypothetical protein
MFKHEDTNQIIFDTMIWERFTLASISKYYPDRTSL